MYPTLLNFYDAEERKRIRANPRAVFEHLEESLNDDIKVKLVENTATTIYLACPALPDEAQALSGRDLRRISAGAAAGTSSTVSTAGSAGTASSVSSTVSTASSLGSGGSFGCVDAG